MSKTNNKEVTVKINNDPEKDPVSLLARFKEKNLFPDRTVDRGIVNDNTSSSVMLKESGAINVSSDVTSNIKVNQDKVITTTIEDQLIANRRILNIDEIIVNHQKLNPQLVELSDTKVLFDNNDQMIGNLTMDGTVLVKTWDLDLKKYVLMRRKIRTPLFSHKLNKIKAPENFDVIADYVNNLTVDTAMLLKQEKEKKEKATAEEHYAVGGEIYDQGDYDNYNTDFVHSEHSMANEGGFSGGYISSTNPDNGLQETTTEKDIITNSDGKVVLLWPVPESSRLTSEYGLRDGSHHNGIDIGRNFDLGEKTKIASSGDGVVIRTQYTPKNSVNGVTPRTGYGQSIEIQHDNGLSTFYAHLSKVLVKEGQRVKAGQHIGYMGNTGKSFGAHLHYTVYGTYDGVTKDFFTGFNPQKFVKFQN